MVFHSDHGYALGERGSWEKMSNEELTLRVPLMVAVPWMHASVGRKSAAIVELLDVYPTVRSALTRTPTLTPTLTLTLALTLALTLTLTLALAGADQVLSALGLSRDATLDGSSLLPNPSPNPNPNPNP